MGTEETGRISVIASSQGDTQSSPVRQLWNGPFSSTLPPPTSPASAFRAQISAKKSLWGTSATSSPSTHTPFSVPPGFSLREASPPSLSSGEHAESTSQPSSPYKPKSDGRVSLYPSSTPQFDSHGHEKTFRQRDISLGLEYSHIDDADVSKTSSSTITYSDVSSLQEELAIARKYSSNLETQCKLLREQVDMLQEQLSRQRAELSRYQADISHPTGQIQRSATETPLPDLDLHSTINTPHPSTDASSKSKKRAREYEPEEDQTVEAKRRVPLSPHSDFDHADIEPKAHQDIQDYERPMDVSIDSQALLDVMDRFEASINREPVTQSIDTATSRCSTIPDPELSQASSSSSETHESRS